MIRNNKLFDSKERPARSSVYSFERFSTFDGNLVAYNAAMQSQIRLANHIIHYIYMVATAPAKHIF